MHLKKLLSNLELFVPITLGVIALASVFFFIVAPELEQLTSALTKKSLTLPKPTLTPSPDPDAFVPDPNSYLSPLKQEAWQDFRTSIPEGQLNKATKYLEPYKLDEHQAEVVEFLFFMGRGFSKVADQKTEVYYSSWHDYSFKFPREWMLFQGDPGRIGVLAPGTPWEPNEVYYNGEVIADFFLHAYCSDTSLEPPVPWKDKESFTKNMFQVRREVYAYSPVSKREDLDFLGYPAAFYIHYVNLNAYDGVAKPYTMLVNEYYFQIDDTVYLFDTRYPEANEKIYKDRLMSIMKSFDPGSAPCNQYDQHFTKPTLGELVKGLYKVVYEGNGG